MTYCLSSLYVTPYHFSLTSRTLTVPIFSINISLIILGSKNSDFKSLLQEYLHTIDKTAEYRCIDEKGPDHEKCFTMALFVDDELISQADGSSKKHAEQLAAEIGLKHYKVGVK